MMEAICSRLPGTHQSISSVVPALLTREIAATDRILIIMLQPPLSYLRRLLHKQRAPLAIAGLLALGLSPDALRAEGDAPDTCVSMMKLHGKYLAEDRNDLANQADGKARAAGCYDWRGDEKLCALFAEQESQFNEDNRADLVNIIRAQEREFQCIQ